MNVVIGVSSERAGKVAGEEGRLGSQELITWVWPPRWLGVMDGGCGATLRAGPRPFWGAGGLHHGSPRWLWHSWSSIYPKLLHRRANACMVLLSSCPYREGDAGRPAAAEAGGGSGWLWTPRSSLVFINQSACSSPFKLQ